MPGSILSTARVLSFHFHDSPAMQGPLCPTEGAAQAADGVSGRGVTEAGFEPAALLAVLLLGNQ